MIAMMSFNVFPNERSTADEEAEKRRPSNNENNECAGNTNSFLWLLLCIRSSRPLSFIIVYANAMCRFRFWSIRVGRNDYYAWRDSIGLFVLILGVHCAHITIVWVWIVINWSNDFPLDSLSALVFRLQRNCYGKDKFHSIYYWNYGKAIFKLIPSEIVHKTKYLQ